MCLIITLIACAPETDPAKMKLPDVGLPESDLNKKITAYAPEGWNKFSTSESITLAVVATQDDMISFRPDDVRIFLYGDEGWHEIKNMGTQYPGDFEYILDPDLKDNLFFVGTTTVLPELSDATIPADLKIFVFGYVLENGKKTNEKVGVIVDVHLEP